MKEADQAFDAEGHDLRQFLNKTAEFWDADANVRACIKHSSGGQRSQVEVGKKKAGRQPYVQLY